MCHYYFSAVSSTAGTPGPLSFLSILGIFLVTQSSYLFTENTAGDFKKTLVRSGAGGTNDNIGFLPLKGLTIICQDTPNV